eukprot:scaffold76941_cov17-Tisochrysis_lutea.AAC.1
MHREVWDQHMLLPGCWSWVLQHIVVTPQNRAMQYICTFNSCFSGAPGTNGNLKSQMPEAAYKGKQSKCTHQKRTTDLRWSCPGWQVPLKSWPNPSSDPPGSY